MLQLKKMVSSYKLTLLSPMMLFFVTIHTIEDLSLLTIGKYAPLPTPLMYGLGLIFSWVVMSGVVHRYLGGSLHKHDNN